MFRLATKARTIGSLGAATGAITVGAMSDPGERGFFLAYFSSRGPTTDGRTKPDLAAPGWYIMSAAAGTTNGYTEKSETSMSTPFVAGLCSLILETRGDLTPAGVRSLLMDSVRDWGPVGADNEYGAGRLDG